MRNETQAGRPEELKGFGHAMLEFAGFCSDLDAPEAVLNRLDEISNQSCRIRVLGALLLPLRWGDWQSIIKGKTVFLHKSAPEGWWDDWVAMSSQYPTLGMEMVHLSLAPITMSDAMRLVEPLGMDRWPFELAIKHGMRDRLTCPVGGRWLISYWSRHSLTASLTPEKRAILFMGATLAAVRLQKLVGIQLDRIGKPITLTPRELAVLRLISLGHKINQVASSLELGAETVRTHLKKAQDKLGVRTTTHAVSQAIRLRMIP